MMKKRKTNADGSSEEIEGTPEELAQYEQLQNPVAPGAAPQVERQKKKPGVLKGSPLADGLAKILDGMKREMERITVPPVWHPYLVPYIVNPAQCSCYNGQPFGSYCPVHGGSQFINPYPYGTWCSTNTADIPIINGTTVVCDVVYSSDLKS